jgi:hypothetical protein
MDNTKDLVLYQLIMMSSSTKGLNKQSLIKLQNQHQINN